MRNILAATYTPTLPARQGNHDFDNDVTLAQVSPTLLEAYLRAAEDLALEASGQIEKLAPCPGSGDNRWLACACTFVDTIGSKLWRRPLSAVERQDLLTLYKVGQQDASDSGIAGYKEGIRQTLTAILVSPRFLYRVENRGKAVVANVFELSDYEMATRLSYLFLGTASSVDPLLQQAAAEGRLHTDGQVAEQAGRLFAGASAKGVVRDFTSQWLSTPKIGGITKNRGVFPTFDPQLAASLRSEVETWVQTWFWSEHPTLQSLFTNATSSPDDRVLKDIYALGTDVRNGRGDVDLARTQRAGILTLPGILAANSYADQTSPIHRGLFVRERMLCQHPPPPPPGLVVTAPKVDAASTTRQRFEQHRNNPTCAGCHQLLDPIGLGFEHYDAIGRFRVAEDSNAIDVTGSLVEVGDDIAGPFEGAIDLSQKLAVSQDVKACVATQILRYGLGRPEQELDDCDLQMLQAALDRPGGVREAWLALTKTKAFKHLYVEN